MKQRIITGIILIILAVAWLVLCIPGQELSIFVYGLSLICVLAAWEYSQFVFPNVINDEHFLKSPKGYFQKNSSYALALRTLYTVSVFAGISFIVNLSIFSKFKVNLGVFSCFQTNWSNIKVFFLLLFTLLNLNVNKPIYLID